MTPARFLLALVASICLAVSACGSDTSAASTNAAPADIANAQGFFEDLPSAREVAANDMGDVYFKLLLRTATKVRAVRDEGDAQATRAIIAYAREQAGILQARSQALPEAQRKELLQASVAQIQFAKKKYARAVERIGPDDPAFLREFGAYASKPWPTLGR